MMGPLTEVINGFYQKSSIIDVYRVLDTNAPLVYDLAPLFLGFQ